MGILDRFEQSLDKLVNGAFAKAFKSELQPVEIAATLQQEMDERAAVVSRSRTLVPNEFTVSVSPEDAERLSTYADAVTGELASLVAEHASEQRYTFLGPIVVRLRADFDGLRIFFNDPILPGNGHEGRNWRDDFQLTLHIQDDVRVVREIS